jgi:uncharacterized protein (TIGR04255 family)
MTFEMTPKTEKVTTLEFESLPLLEVTLKRVPRAHIPMSLHLVTGIWDKLRGDFDRILDLQVLEMPPGNNRASNYDALATTGCRLISEAQGVTITLQTDVLVVKWVAASGKPYPRYEAMQGFADKIVAAINEISVLKFEAMIVNLAYANRLEAISHEDGIRPEFWPFNSSWSPAALVGEAKPQEYQTAFRDGNDVDHKCLLHQLLEAGTGKAWYLLINVAGRELKDHGELQQAESAVHDALIRWFPAMLSDEALTKFGYRGAN